LTFSQFADADKTREILSGLPVYNNTTAKPDRVKLNQIFNRFYEQHDSSQDDVVFSSEVFNATTRGTSWKPDLVDSLRVMAILTTAVHRFEKPWADLGEVLSKLQGKELLSSFHGIAIFLFAAYCEKKTVSEFFVFLFSVFSNFPLLHQGWFSFELRQVAEHPV